MVALRYEISLRVEKYLTRERSERVKGGCEKLRSHSNGDIFTCEDNMLFSHMKIKSFSAKAHLIFHWCLYNKLFYLQGDRPITYPTSSGFSRPDAML